ncbi:HU family DNA-binding protein [Loktanella sp. DJP18]|uniref:HU family DNA-binding protein n=1 Tax=Loktanella sp. DJP18 TaxID=3409788 RepID=UPI003BB49BE2
MVRSELIQKLREEHPSLPLKTAEAIVEVVFGTMLTTLARGNRVELRGFGSFTPRTRSARMSRNPRTGEAVPVAEKKVACFRTSRSLLERLTREADRARKQEIDYSEGD